MWFLKIFVKTTTGLSEIYERNSEGLLGIFVDQRLYAQCDFVFWQSNSVSGSIHIPYKLQYLLARFHCSLSLYTTISLSSSEVRKKISFRFHLPCHAMLICLCSVIRVGLVNAVHGFLGFLKLIFARLFLLDLCDIWMNYKQICVSFFSMLFVCWKYCDLSTIYWLSIVN